MDQESIYNRLFGLNPVIPLGHPWLSATGGPRLSAEVIEAMSEAANYKINMTDLLLQSGEAIAEMLGAEAAFITSCDCAAHTLATAGIMAGTDAAKMEQLPDTECPVPLKNEFIIQVGMHEQYINAFRAAGGKLVWVGGKGSGLRTEYDQKTMKIKIKGIKITPEEVEHAINERTAGIIAAIHCGPSAPPPCTLPVEEAIKIAKKYGIPTIVDAPHVPAAGGKVGRAFLRKYIDMGVDLVCVSGGKGIEGPNATGIIYGKKDLIQAAAPQGAPGIPLYAGTPQEVSLPRTLVGRGFKVSKEQIVGLVVALKRYLAMDDDAITSRDTKVCQWIADQFNDFPHIKVTGLVPENNWPNDNMYEGGPSCILDIDEKSLGIRVTDVPKLMLGGDSPAVEIGLGTALAPWGKLQLFSHGLKDNEVEIVIDKLKRVLSIA
ncbi:aminotransferase class I/II-fold pyridoxal phosphate-dependent enzyme [Chloroflexota bacterium]